MSDLASYAGREQTYLKHFVLGKYLERLALIVGPTYRTITYVDCFSGPWESRDPNYEDTSFVVALKALRSARAQLALRGISINIRCFFLEKNVARFRNLATFVDAINDVEIRRENKDFVEAIDDILQFVRAGGSDNFTFTFIDPTGWSGFPLQVITPLLKVRGEVLINFMTEHIRRFAGADDVEIEASFRGLYDGDVKAELAGLASQQREERLVRLYMLAIKRAGQFQYVGSAVIFKPDVEKTNFHLVYATRNDKGVAVFKEVEQKLAPETEVVRAAAKKNKRETGQQSFLSATDLYPSTRLKELRERYVAEARARTLGRLRKHGSEKYNVLWRRAVAYPLVWTSDLNGWLEEWRLAGKVRIDGLTGRQKPRWDRDITITWIG
ncbi:MAG TPA: three-Cys-motif partner protein TcmP [Thermoanaerobaculia bacterium]|nr:three-Cys-motif partner protein TcmP [Thermoanaerobaculia bacterium]